MVAAAASTPEAMTVLAVQKLYYNINPSPVVGVFLILSTQMLGYGLAGVLRRTLVYPSNMLYPTNLPTASLLESLHKDRKEVKKKLRIFNYAFGILFLWQSFPQYIMPLLAGLSVFCLSMQHSPLVTHLFGGSMANEGLGVLSMSFDWTMVCKYTLIFIKIEADKAPAAHGNPLWIPFQTLMNTLVGYLLAIGIYMGIYYNNLWDAERFPFMSTTLFSDKSTREKFVQYNQTRILNSKYQVDAVQLAKQGLPRLTASHALGMSLQNLAIMAAITHMCLWHWSDIKSAGEVFSPLKMIFKPKEWNFKFWKYEPKKITDEEAEEICPHYRVMQAYKDVPNSWFALIWVIAAVVGLITSRLAGSTLDVWAFFVAIILAGVLVTPFAALTAMFGFHMNVQPLIQMIGAYMLPGRPLANLYFSTYGFNSLYMAKNMLKVR
jgi:OPT family oligopeptide transporter